jgi:hypothetical protein
LREEQLVVTIETECGHCGQPMRISLGSDMQAPVHDEGADPLVFMPQIDWQSFKEPNIIDAY